jgi:CheY-like chemotaxis protein
MSKNTVLVVDDDPEILSATAQLLREEGYEPFTCKNGRDALEWLHEHEPPSVILLDVKMPLMDGWTMWQESRYVRGIRDIPVIIMTADTRMERKAELAGVAGFLQKPFDVDVMIEMIQAVARPTGSSVALSPQ